MRRFPLRISLVVITTFITGCGNGWFARWNTKLQEVERQQREGRKELASLGEPILSNTVPQFGFVAESGRTLGPQPPLQKERWIQVDLGQVTEIDRIALVPVLMDWQRLDHPAYYFPKRFRLDISREENFENPVAIASFMERDYPDPGVTPVVFDPHKQTARFIRLTSTARQYALSEIIVIKGNRNIAIGCKVTLSDEMTEDGRWSKSYLVDGRSPMGPPILYEPLEYDGMYFGPTNDGSLPFVQMDFGEEKQIDEVRLHPVHSRTGADFPGYKFPVKFRMEVSKNPGFESPNVIFETLDPFPNPANNPVTIPFKNVRSRFLRLVFIPVGDKPYDLRFCLSEMEVFSGDTNIAPTALITGTPDPYPTRKDWPDNILVDGCTSFGRILPLPQLLDNWVRRQKLLETLAVLDGQQVELLAQSARRQLILTTVGWTLFVVGIAGVGFYMRRKRAHDLEMFRRQLTQDLHDEVGSNLAAIGMISEAASNAKSPIGSEVWSKVQKISRETTDAMRETLWMAGGKAEGNIDLMKHLQLTAARMLSGLTTEWRETVKEFPESWPQEKRRQVFLIFKEALANVIRHSQASAVFFSARIVDSSFELEIKDNGKGFVADTVRRGMGLNSLRDRANKLGANLEISSAPDQGTRVRLIVKLG